MPHTQQRLSSCLLGLIHEWGSGHCFFNGREPQGTLPSGPVASYMHFSLNVLVKVWAAQGNGQS